MAKKKEPTVEEKLRALYDLQLIDSRIDKIRDVRGELPLEVRDLEDDIEGLNTRIEKVNASLKELEDQISYKKNLIDEAKALIKKYTEQQKNVRNNREFDSLTKETEYQELEIQLAEKNINEYKAQIELKKESIEEVEAKLKDLRERWPEIDIAVDGGIDDTNISSAVKNGANLIVSGSHLYRQGSLKEAISELRNIALQNQ